MPTHVLAHIAAQPGRLQLLLQSRPYLRSEFEQEEERLGRSMTIGEKIWFADLDEATR